MTVRVLKRVLLVDDNVDHADLISDCLMESRPDLVVTHLLAAEDVLPFLLESLKNNELPDLVLLDIKMPRMSGKEILSAIKEIPGLRAAPIVMLTSSENAQDVRDCFSVGACSYIEKPMGHAALRAKLTEFSRYWEEISLLPTVLGEAGE